MGALSTMHLCGVFLLKNMIILVGGENGAGGRSCRDRDLVLYTFTRFIRDITINSLSIVITAGYWCNAT